MGWTARVKVGWQDENNTYGVVLFDASGNKRVVLGQLPNGDHGIELIDASGHTQELLPSLDNYHLDGISDSRIAGWFAVRHHQPCRVWRL